jgi:hypothetical protein
MLPSANAFRFELPANPATTDGQSAQFAQQAHHQIKRLDGQIARAE